MSSINILLLNKPGNLIPINTLNSWKRFYSETIETSNLPLEYNLENWADELIYSVGKIKSKYFLLTPSDFICLKKLPNEFLESFGDLEPNYIRLKLRPGASKILTRISTSSYKLFCIDPSYKYSINLQPAIWEKDYLLSLLKLAKYYSLSIWQFDNYIYKFLSEKLKKRIFLFEALNNKYISSHYVKKGVQFRSFKHHSSTYKKANLYQLIIFNLKLEIFKLADYISHKINTA